MKEGLLDAIYPMTYGEGLIQGRVDTFTSFAGDKGYVFMGVGTYKGLGDAETFKQTITSRNKADGAAYFEYLTYISHQSNTFLKETAYKDAAVTPTLNSTEAAKAQIDFINKRINEVILKYSGMDEAKAKTVTEKLTALKDNLTTENTPAVVSEIESLISGQKSEAVLKSDLAKLTKIVTLSRDAQKAAYKPVDKTTDNSETSDVSNSTSENVETSNSNTWIWIVLGAVVVVAIIGILLVMKKKKN